MKTFAALLLAAAAASVQAHGGKAPNGGQMRDAGPWHVELVVERGADGTREAPLRVYLFDGNDRKQASAGTRAKATLLAGGQRASVTLGPDGDNRLSGSARYRATPDMAVVVAITFADGSVHQVRFEPLKP